MQNTKSQKALKYILKLKAHKAKKQQGRSDNRQARKL
jgi:hypothetical protein